MKITYSEPKYYLGISGKGVITSMGINTIRRSKKSKKARYAITNFSPKDLSKIIKEFDYFSYECYVRKRFEHVPTYS